MPVIEEDRRRQRRSGRPARSTSIGIGAASVEATANAIEGKGNPTKINFPYVLVVADRPRLATRS